jgi:cytidylate kinase
MVEIIAIDGPASVGKSTLAKKIAYNYESPILSSGRLYRAVAVEVINRKISPNDEKAIANCVKLIDQDKLKSKKLFSSEVDKISSIISANKFLRNRLKSYQRNFPKYNSKNNKYVVIEGRDIGTIIFPNAKYKIFMWADAKTRAKRRFAQILKNGKNPSLQRIYKEIVTRDMNDLTRSIAPLKPAVNSVLLDTTYLDIEQAFNIVRKLIKP